MGEMISNIAHQWRQPLNMLGLIVQELRMTYGREEFSKESLEASVKKAMELISHMSQTIDGFSNYFKPDMEKRRFNVNQAVAKTLSLLEPSLKNLNIKIMTLVTGDTDINGYENEYSQVLFNILLNCRDAFEASNIDRQRVITITVFKENNKSVVTVADNAGGIPEDIMDKIFDPYFTTKGPDKGTGIGLYMAKTIIEKNMEGRLTVRNIAYGAEFRIEV
jgi:signal transduction histidine kinase